jgi:hypothetical protein
VAQTLTFIYSHPTDCSNNPVCTPFSSLHVFYQQAKEAETLENLPPTVGCLDVATGMRWRVGGHTFNLEQLREGIRQSEEDLRRLLEAFCAGSDLYSTVFSMLLDGR